MSKSLGIIGTAGRKEDALKLSKEKWGLGGIQVSLLFTCFMGKASKPWKEIGVVLPLAAIINLGNRDLLRLTEDGLEARTFLDSGLNPLLLAMVAMSGAGAKTVEKNILSLRTRV